MRNELRKEAFYSELENILEDVELLLKDYGFDVNECLDDEENCEAEDEYMFRVMSLYSQLKTTIEESR